MWSSARPSAREQEVEKVRGRGLATAPPDPAAADPAAAADPGAADPAARAAANAVLQALTEVSGQIVERVVGEVEDVVDDVIGQRAARLAAGVPAARSATRSAAAAFGLGAAAAGGAAVTAAGVRRLGPRGRLSGRRVVRAAQLALGGLGLGAVRAHRGVVLRQPEVLVDPGLVRAEPGDARVGLEHVGGGAPVRRGPTRLSGLRVAGAREVPARAGEDVVEAEVQQVADLVELVQRTRLVVGVVEQ